MAKTQTRRTISVSGACYERSRAWCAARGRALAALVEELLDDWLDANRRVDEELGVAAPPPPPSPPLGVAPPWPPPSPPPSGCGEAIEAGRGRGGVRYRLGHQPGAKRGKAVVTAACHAPCAQCGAGAGELCRSRSGAVVYHVHAVRRLAHGAATAPAVTVAAEKVQAVDGKAARMREILDVERRLAGERILAVRPVTRPTLVVAPPAPTSAEPPTPLPRRNPVLPTPASALPMPRAPLPDWFARGL